MFSSFLFGFVYNRYDNGAVPFHELPGSANGHAELHLLRRSKDGQAVAFAWMTEAGVFHGSLKLSAEMNSGDSAMAKVRKGGEKKTVILFD
jgi:hypothetical protein